MRFLILFFLFLNGAFAQEKGLLFDTEDFGGPGTKAPIINAWNKVALEPEYGGYWVVTGDVDGDGETDIVSCENVNKGDVHYTSTAVAQRLDGSVIWKWGNPGIGRKQWHHDVACQIIDWDGDGKNEVVLLTKGFLVELDGETGKEVRRFPIQKDATDCLVFADLSNKGHPSDVLVKTRYSQIWAYNIHGKLLWTVQNPGGSRTAHQPRPIDVDGDGTDEIMVGYALLNADGSVRWTFQSKAVDKDRGHLDTIRLLKKAANPKDARYVLTCCGANNIACVNGNGKLVWEKSGFHFESIQTGFIIPGLEGPQILVDIDHRPRGESPLWVLSSDGERLGQMMTDYCRHHGLLDWTGDGYSEIMLPDAHGIFNAKGERTGTFNTGKPGQSILFGDMTGDGISDVSILTTNPEKVFIFKNMDGTKDTDFLGCGVNFTLY
jgi:outer membrane protein assembly factor BamB